MINKEKLIKDITEHIESLGLNRGKCKNDLHWGWYTGGRYALFAVLDKLKSGEYEEDDNV